MDARRPGSPSRTGNSFLEFTACPGPALFPRVPHVVAPREEPEEAEGSGTDDDDGIIREEDGPPLVEDAISEEVAARTDLRALAKHLSHLLPHLPKNPYCQTCQLAKMCNQYTKRGAFKRKPKKFRDLVTCDHMVTRALRMEGCMGEGSAFVVKGQRH